MSQPASLRFHLRNQLPRLFRWRWLIFAGWWLVLVTVALVIRWWLAAMPYWYDEALTMHYIRQPVGRMLQLVLADIHLPAYYLVLKAWVWLVGGSSIATAGLSLLLSLLAAFLVYRTGRDLVGKRNGLIAAGVFLVSLSVTLYSVETRMYMLLNVAAIGSVFYLFQWRRGSAHANWGWVAFNTLGLLTHGLYVFFLAAQALTLVWWRRQGITLPLRIRSMLVLAFVALPVFLVLAVDFQHWFLARQNWFQVLAKGLSVEDWAVFLSQRPFLFFYPVFHTPWWLNYPLAIFFIVGLAAAVWNFHWEGHRLLVSRRPITPELQALFFFAVVPVVLLVIFRIKVDRYVAYVTPCWALWLVHGLPRSPQGWLTRWVLALLGGAMVGTQLWFVRTDLLLQPDFRWPEVIEHLQSHTAEDPDGAVLVNSYDWLPIVWEYYHGPLPVLAFFPPSMVSDGDVERAMFSRIGLASIRSAQVGELKVMLAPYRAIWLVNTGSQIFTDPEDVVQQYLITHCQLTHFDQLPKHFRSGHAYELKQFTDCRWPSDRAL